MIILLQCLYSYKLQLLVCLFMSQSHACRSQLVHLARKLLNKGDSYVNCATYISIMPLHLYHIMRRGMRKCYMGVYIISFTDVCIYRFYTEVDIKSFPNWIAFLSWKEEEEKLTYTCFVKPNDEIIHDTG